MSIKLKDLLAELELSPSKALPTIEKAGVRTGINVSSLLSDDEEMKIRGLFGPPALDDRFRFELAAIASEYEILERMGAAREKVQGWVNDLLSGRGYPENVSSEVEKAITILAGKVIEYNNSSLTVAGYSSTPVAVGSNFLQLLDEPLPTKYEDLPRLMMGSYTTATVTTAANSTQPQLAAARGQDEGK